NLVYQFFQPAGAHFFRVQAKGGAIETNDLFRHPRLLHRFLLNARDRRYIAGTFTGRSEIAGLLVLDDRPAAGDVFPIGLGEARPEARRKSIAIIRVIGAVLAHGQHGATAAAVERVTAAPADGIARHRPPPPEGE